MDGHTDTHEVKTVYPPVSPRSLGGYNKQWTPTGAGPWFLKKEEAAD